MAIRVLLSVMVSIVLAGTFLVSCNDKNPVSSDKPAKVYKNFDMYGNLGMGSGVYYTIILPVNTTKINSVRIRKDEDSSWEEWSDWSRGEQKITILDYSLKIRNWDYWITVRVWIIE